MQLQDVEKLIQNGEFETVEFKAGFNNDKRSKSVLDSCVK
jgi:predicted HTH transcriptional regulator